MDLSVFDTGLTPRNLNGLNSGARNLDLDDDIFSDTLLEVSERADDSYDSGDVFDDTYRDEGGSEDEVAAEEDESAEGNAQTNSDVAALSPLELLLGIQAANTLNTSGGTTTKTSGDTSVASNASPDSAARTAGLEIQNSGKPTAAMATAQASLSGEAKTLNKRAQVIQANEMHALGNKTRLTNSAEQKAAQTATMAKAIEGAQTKVISGREAGAPGNEIARLEQALRQAFPSSGNETTNTTANNTASAALPRAGGDTLLTARGGEPITDASTNLATTAERPTAMATAKAAATRPAFNLPNGRPAEQVSVQVQNGIRNGNDRIQIKLSPASLGNVEVKLELSPDKTVQAIVYADKPETLDMLERDARVLQKALEEAGLRTNSDSLSFAQRDPGGSADAQSDTGDGPGDQRNMNAGTDSKSDNNTHLIDLPTRRSHDGLIDIEA